MLACGIGSTSDIGVGCEELPQSTRQNQHRSLNLCRPWLLRWNRGEGHLASGDHQGGQRYEVAAAEVELAHPPLPPRRHLLPRRLLRSSGEVRH